MKPLQSILSGNNRQLLVSGGVSLFVRGGGALGILLLTIFINRLLPAEEAGLFFVGQTILPLIAAVGLFGFDTAALRFMPIETSRNQSGYLHQALRLTLPVTLLLAALTAAGLQGYSAMSGKPVSAAVWLLIPAAAALALNLLLSQGLFAKHRVGAGTLLQTAFIPWGTILLLGIVFFLPANSRFFCTAFGYTLICVLSAAGGYLLLYPAAKRAANPMPYREIFYCSLPLMAIALLNQVLAATDKLMLSYFDSAALVAPYEAARQSVRVGELLLVSCNCIVAPRFAAMWHAGTYGELKSLLYKSTGVLFLFSLGLLGFFLLFGKFLMRLNNPEFAADSSVLWILAVGQCVVLGTGPVAYFLMMTGKERWHRNNVIGCVIGNVLLNYWLIPRYGIVGAALGSTITLILKNLVTCGQAFYILRKLPSQKESRP